MSENITFVIRPAVGSDVPQILDLIKALAKYEKLLHEVEADESLIKRFGFGDEKYFHVLLVEDRTEPEVSYVGFALYFYTFSTFLARPTLYLEDLYVIPEKRGAGIGKSLLKKLAKIALKKECGRIEWAVLDWNEPAINFYKDLGAKPMSEWTVFRLLSDDIEKLAGN